MREGGQSRCALNGLFALGQRPLFLGLVLAVLGIRRLHRVSAASASSRRPRLAVPFRQRSYDLAEFH